jgi:hypothetical protein
MVVVQLLLFVIQVGEGAEDKTKGFIEPKRL